MGDKLKKVKPGDPLEIPAATFNTLVDVARDYLHRRHDQRGHATTATRRDGTVLVRNDTGTDQGRFAILAIDSPLFGHNEAEFFARPTLKATVPDGRHEGRVVVLAEPIDAGKVGPAWIGGIVPARLYDPHGAAMRYTTASVKPGDTSQLALNTGGQIDVVWHETGYSPGTRWGLVRLGPAVPRHAQRIVGFRNDSGVTLVRGDVVQVTTWFASSNRDPQDVVVAARIAPTAIDAVFGRLGFVADESVAAGGYGRLVVEGRAPTPRLATGAVTNQPRYRPVPGDTRIIQDDSGPIVGVGGTYSLPSHAPPSVFAARLAWPGWSGPQWATTVGIYTLGSIAAAAGSQPATSIQLGTSILERPGLANVVITGTGVSYTAPAQYEIALVAATFAGDLATSTFRVLAYGYGVAV